MKDILTYLILFILCGIRVSAIFLDNFSGSIASYSFILMLLVIVLNTNSLEKMNFDKYFMHIFLFSCVIYAFFYTNFIFGVVIFFQLYLIYQKNQLQPFDFSTYVINNKTLLLFLLTFLIFYITQGPLDLSFQNIVSSFTKAKFFGVLFEEFLFRGLIWMCLRKINLKDNYILVIQTFLFWFAHYNTFEGNSVSFLLVIPYVSLILGLLVYYSKALSISFAAHLLYNFFIGITS